MRTSLAVLLLAVLPACNIYWGDDGDDCYYGEGDIAWSGLRNPENGACESFGGGGGGGCGDDYATGGAEDGARAPLPDWGECPSACEQLSESDCMAAERCRAVYTVTECPPDALCDEPPTAFYGCWSIAPSGPAYERVACESLDAYECSRHNDCVGLYNNVNWAFAALEAPPLQFQSCAAELVQGCYGDGDCPAGWNCTSDTDCLPPPGCDPQNGGACPPVCYGVCEPPAGSCATIDCGPGYHCEETCSGGTMGGACDPSGNCDSACTAECVPDQNMCPILCPPNTECVEVCNGGGGSMGGGESDQPQPVCTWECLPPGPTCAGTTCPVGSECEIQCDPNGTCSPVCVPGGGGACAAVDCGPGYHCEETCAGGACTATCTPNQDPGACTGVVLCDSLPPSCPAGTTAGIRDGCWTGFCIPDWACGFMTPNN